MTTSLETDARDAGCLEIVHNRGETEGVSEREEGKIDLLRFDCATPLLAYVGVHAFPYQRLKFTG